MIVLVSDNAEAVTRISTLLKQKGDLFTVAADEFSAYAAIRADRATLLIVDTASSAFNGFALCRSIKDDPDLGGLPVLCLIDLADVTSILSVLDCGGDGFLTPPVDLSSLSSAIGDILDRQAEGAGKGPVPSRFRVNHDGREFSVLADRRQLLEFLLSAFESAIRVRCDTEHVRDDCKRELFTINKRLAAVTTEREGTVAALHRELEERKEALASAVSTLEEKEQSEAFLKARFENVAQELKDLGTALEETRKADQEKSRRIATLESDNAAAAVERKNTEQDLNARIAGLRSQLNDATLEKDSARSTVAALDVRLAELDRQLTAVQEELILEKERARSLSADLDQVTADHAAEQRNREALEKALGETRAAAEAKEQEFRSAIDNITADMRSLETALQNNLRQLEKELAVRKDLEREVESLTRERDSLDRAKVMLEEKCSRLQGDLQETVAVSGAREREMRSALDNVNNDLNSIQGALEQNLRHLEGELRARKDLEQQVTDLSRERETLIRNVNDAEATLEGLRAQLAGVNEVRARLEEELDASRAEHERVRVSLGETSRSLEEVQERKRLLNEEAEEKERRATGEIARLNATIEGLNKDLEKLREENRLLGVEAVEKERQAAAEISGLNGKLSVLAQDLGKLEDENRVLGEVREKERIATAEISGLNEKLSGLSQDLEKLQEENRALGDARERERQATAEVDRLKETVDALTRDLGEIQAKNTALAAAQEREYRATAQVADLNEKVAGLSRERERLREENLALSAAQEREQAATGEISGLNEKIAALNRELAEKEQAIANGDQLIAQAGEEHQSLSDKFRDARASLESASAEIGALKAALGEERELKKAAIDQQGAAERDSAEKDRAIARLQAELDAARSPPPARTPDGEFRAEPEGPPSPVSPDVSESIPAAAETTTAPPVAKTDDGQDVTVAAISAPSAPVPLPAGMSPISLPVTEPAGAPLPEAPPAPLPGETTLGHVPEQAAGDGAAQSSPAMPPAAPPYAPPRSAAGDLMISRDRWLDIIKWAHHSGALQPEERKSLISDLMRLSKLVQKGRHLTNRQEQEVRALVSRVQSLGYRFV